MYVYVAYVFVYASVSLSLSFSPCTLYPHLLDSFDMFKCVVVAG